MTDSIEVQSDSTAVAQHVLSYPITSSYLFNTLICLVPSRKQFPKLTTTKSMPQVSSCTIYTRSNNRQFPLLGNRIPQTIYLSNDQVCISRLHFVGISLLSFSLSETETLFPLIFAYFRCVCVCGQRSASSFFFFVVVVVDDILGKSAAPVNPASYRTSGLNGKTFVCSVLLPN